MWHDHTCSARELKQQKEQWGWGWGWGLEMAGKWDGGWTKLEKKGVGNVGGLNKIGEVLLYKLCEETLKISHRAIIKPTSLHFQ